MTTAILPLPLIQEEQLSGNGSRIMANECALSPGKLPLGNFPRTSVVRITDRPDMSSAVYHGAITGIYQTNKQMQSLFETGLMVLLTSLD